MEPDLVALARETRFFPLAEGGIVYLVRQKKIYGLNAPAALIWQDVAEERSPTGTIRRLEQRFALDAQTARQWHDLALASFTATILRDAGASESVPDEPCRQAPAPFSGGETYRFFDERVRIAAPPEALARINTLIGHLREAEPPPGDDGDLWVSVTADGSRFRVSSGGDPPTREGVEGLTADVERRIVQDIVPRAPHFLAFHGALLARHDDALLLTAPSGSGKTTLAVALARAGWSLLTDELALLDRDLSWRGLPLRPCVKRENYDLIQRLFPGIEGVVEHVRFDRRVKFIPLPVVRASTALKTVIFPQFKPGSAAAVRSLVPAEGLQRLLEQCVYIPLGFNEDDILRLIEWHGRVEYLSLEFGDAQAVVSLLEA